MKIREVLNSKECKPIFREIEEFVKLSLFEYNNAIEKDGFCFSDKDIFDFVWGTVNFSATEICVLDSPLLQRLRRIRQLGLASQVYCNADSSRFSHTIGVTEVADRMARVIEQKLNANVNATYDVNEIVRLAAIFHDVGHMFFSHVSELYFAYDDSFPRYQDVTVAKNYFCEKTSSNVSLHELFSVMIVNSSETIRLLKNIAPYMKKSRLIQQSHYEQVSEYISCLIIGIPIDKFILPYSSIINSAVDADKLDYLSRDSACTKVPIAVDIARIIQKLDVVNIKGIEYPAIWNDASSDATPLKIMAIKSSARKVFWQLSNARSSMYESVYYHHKVLTAETMFRKALQKLYSSQTKEEIKFTQIMQLTDDIFNEYWDLVLLAPEKRDTDEKREIEKILKCVRERDLYKRVAAFSKDSFKAPISIIGTFFRTVIQNPLSDEYNQFCVYMTEEYHKIRNILNLQNVENDKPTFMFIYSNYTAMASMPVENGDGFCVWSSSLMKQETMEAGKKAKQEQFYLLTDCKDRAIVYLALEKVLSKYGIEQLAKEASICSKISIADLNSYRLMLLEHGYYKECLYLIQDDIFLRLFDRRLFDEVVRKYQSFQGVNSCQITNESLLAYLRQFLRLQLEKNEIETLLDGVLRLLKEANYLDRDSYSQGMTKLVQTLTEKIDGKKYIVTLGGVFDSAKHIMYYFNDVDAKENLTFSASVESVLDDMGDEKCLCFFDDGAYSGKQVISIFQELMGVPIEKRTTSEQHEKELSDINKEKLKKCKIVLAYLCFNNSSQEYIKTELENIGIKNFEIHFVKNLDEKIFDDNGCVFKDENQKELVKQCLKQIGEDILMSSKKLLSGEYKERWDEERVKKSALGYNDAQQMVIFSSNIPTYSITAFWANGKFGKHEWKGLFQRTNKD